jgi:hypothetical protein
MLDARGFIAETNANPPLHGARRRCRDADGRRLPRGHHARHVLDPGRAEGIPHDVRDFLALTELYRADEAFCTRNQGRARRRHARVGTSARIGAGPGRGDDEAPF